MSTLKFDPSSLSIIVNAGIKALHPTTARLVIDTGASLVVLPWRLATAIGIKIDPKHTVETTTATAVETVPQVIIPEIKVLGKSVKNVEAIIKDLPSESHVDGLLGLSFLKNFKLTIDFNNGYLTLE